MLEIEILPDGGVRITGSEHDLEQLRAWLLVALVHGSAAPTFVTDLSKTSIVIEVAPGGATP